jgi:hypothetical protein
MVIIYKGSRGNWLLFFWIFFFFSKMNYIDFRTKHELRVNLSQLEYLRVHSSIWGRKYRWETRDKFKELLQMFSSNPD